MIRVVAVGRVGQDPELRSTTSGLPVCKFSIASTSQVAGKDITSWVRCVAWRGAAEAIAKYVRKGHQFSVAGNLRDNRWKDTDGRERVQAELHVDQFQLLSNGPRPETVSTTENSEVPENVDFSDMQ